MAEEDEKKEDENAEAEGTDGEGEEGEEGGKKKSKKLLIIIVAAVLVIGGGAGVFLSGMLGGGDKTETSEDEHSDDHSGDSHGDEHTDKTDDHANEHANDGHGGEKQSGLVGAPVYYELPDFIVNLNTGGRRTSFLKMKVVLELANQDLVLQMDAYKPRILDAFNTYLRELRTSDLAGSAGIYRLRQELMLRIEKSVGVDVVTDILFKEIVVQ